MLLRSLRRAARAASSSTRARMSTLKVHYTYTDEAPMLATYALLPVLRRFAAPAGIDFEKVDISLAARALAAFSDQLPPAQRVPDALAALADAVKSPTATIVKLPNISASVPQLIATIAELRAKGFALPPFPARPSTPAEVDAAARYAKVLGSAVNPVLREGNSDRRVAAPVKAFARAHPHKLLPWAAGSRTRVAHMEAGDFFGSEQSVTLGAAARVTVTLHPAGGGAPRVLRAGIALAAGDIADAATMSIGALRAFYARAFAAAKAEGLLASLHLKATMMKVSDPIFFGAAVDVFFAPALAKHGAALRAAGADSRNGFADVAAKAAALPEPARAAAAADFAAALAAGPALAMVDSRRGITNLHVPSDVIIDASMPCVVRDGGRMWNAADELQDTLAIIPDRTYARVYDVIVRDVQARGQFDVRTMGSTANVGLMARKAEEYGSHDKTFEVPAAGVVRVTDERGAQLFEHAVEAGDVWRMCTTGDAPVRDWVALAVARARATGAPATFWLDAARAHDAQLIAKVRAALARADTSGLAIDIAAPEAAMAATCARARAGGDSIAVTGNVLRDYLTDLFPILELGTSAKMLSIVPMMAGGGMYETGAGGSAPKHVQQFAAEGHLRWDSLGEYLAVAAALEDAGTKAGHAGAARLGAALLEAVDRLLAEDKSPRRKARELDNRGSTFYVALYWAEALAARDAAYRPLAEALAKAKDGVLAELVECQGKPVDLGGYYKVDEAKAEKAMRPSAAFNKIIDA